MKSFVLKIGFFTLWVLCFVGLNHAFAQSATPDPTGTSLSTSGTQVAGDGITYTYTNSSWPSSCIGWGFNATNTALACINGKDTPPWNCGSYFTTSSSVSGDTAYINTTTTINYVNTEGDAIDGTVSARIKFTATTTGGTAINFGKSGNIIFIPVTGNFIIKVEMQLYGPSDAIWFDNNNYQNQWQSALTIYDNLHTNDTDSIYTNFDFSETSFYSLPSSSTTPTITSPNPCGGTVTSSGFTFTWSGNCTAHPNSRYESSFNGGAWTNHGTSTSRAVTLSIGSNRIQVRYYDGCNAAYYTTAVCYIYYTPLNYCGDINHGGNDWTISSDTTVAGRHYNVGTFTVNDSRTATVDPNCHYFTVEAENINVLGTINANGAGQTGGNGGAYGGLWAEGGYTDGSGITHCWDKDSCRALGQGGGSGGSAGSGTGGGNAGGAGGIGYGSKQECKIIGDKGGVVGGGGGGGGG
nr:hypothetical protein [Bacteroidales bacterium]